MHLAVGRHHRRRLQFGRVKISLADHMHTCSGIYHKLCFLRFYGGCGRHNPLLGRRIECSFVLFFEFAKISGKIPCLASGASLLSFSLCLRSVLKFHSVGTSLMRKFDLYFSKRCSFIFSDTCLTWRRLCESYPSNWSQDFLHRVSPGLFSSLRIQCFRVLRDATQLWYSFHNSHSMFVVAFSSFVGMIALFRLFVWLFVNLMMREQTLIPGGFPRYITLFGSSNVSESCETQPN